jgi:hypothetical protein
MRSTCLFLCLASVLAFAQSYTGSISGRVSDHSGLPVPKVAVTITEESTNTVIKTITNDSGDYIATYLKPGVYKIAFSVTGFREHVESGVGLQINQDRRVDPTLEVGEVTDQVQVTASSTQVDYVSPEIGQVVDADQLVNLPENVANNRGRSPFLLAKLLPGVTTNGNVYNNINGYSFSGGRRETNEILVDGLPTTNPSDETYTLTPSPDAVQEFKVLTTPFSAEYGHTGGGVMIATTRSGSNALHGSMYDFFRNRLLNGRDFFSPTQSATRYVQNDPGYTVGGPVEIPKVYDGRNKTFFFVDFNVTLATTGNVYSGLVPTDQQKSGDFSQTFSGGQLVPIYDPTTVHAGANGTMVRNQFPGNIIPANRIDPVAAQIVKFYPEPNGSFNGNNYIVTPPGHNDDWQYLGRIDQNFGPNDRAFFRFGQYSPNSPATPDIPNKANNQTAGGWTDTQAVMSETHVFSPTIVNDFRFGWVQEDNYTSAGGSAAPELGLKGVSLASFPTISVSQMIQLGSNPSNHDRDRSWVFSDGLTWLRGRHSIKIGGDLRRQMYNDYNPGKLSGSYSFSNTFSTDTPNDSKAGFGLADLLLGTPATTTINFNDYTYRESINSAGMFIQDDFKVTPHLTVNLGLRWEFDGPYTEAHNQYASFNPYLINPTTGNLGTVQFAGRNGAPRNFSPNIYHDFLPRVGFAWNFAPNTALRGGYGIYRLPSIGYATTGLQSQYAVSATFQSLDNNVTPAYYLTNGVPAYSYNVDANGNPNIPASLSKPASNAIELEGRVRTPYNQTWQIGLQRQFGHWLAEADYVGTKGTKLPEAIPLNQLPASEWGISSNPQSLRPFAQYLTVTYLANDATSFYNALEASLQRRWANGVLSFSYTWSKVTDYVDGPANSTAIQDIYNLQAEHGIASYNVPQRFVASYVYRIPLGRGSKLANGLPVVQDVIRGWELSGITEFQIGLPMAIQQSSNGLGGFTGIQRPDQIATAALPRDQRTLAQWFNTAAFIPAPAFIAGTEPRYSLYGPGINNWDAALMRNFPIRERLNLQFRGEFYNAMNHPNFKNPNTTIGNISYGKITSDNGARVMEVAVRIFF